MATKAKTAEPEVEQDAPIADAGVAAATDWIAEQEAMLREKEAIAAAIEEEEAAIEEKAAKLLGETNLPGHEPPPYDPISVIMEKLQQIQDDNRSTNLRMRALEQNIPTMINQTVSASVNNKPPLTLRANVADNFISRGTQTPHFGHYRCERMKATKLIEYDMEQMRALQAGEADWAKDKYGRKLSLASLCQRAGSWITVLDGHIYPTSQNQKDCLLEYYKLLPEEQGGMPDLYEDTGSQVWRCDICQNSTEVWSTREGYDNHRLHVHGVIAQAA